MMRSREELEKEITALRKINRVLMDRVEHAVNSSGNDYSIFEYNILLQKHVEERTAELERANIRLAALLEEQRRIGTELKESEERNRLIFEQSGDAMMTLESPSWKITSCNPALNEMFGLTDINSLGELDPRALSPEFQPDGLPSTEKLMAMIEKAMREGASFFEWTHRRLGGETFPATVRLTRIEMAGKVFLHATVHDITEQKRAELILRESEERVRRQRTAIAELAFDEAVTGGDLEGVAKRITRMLTETMHIARAGVWLFSPDRSELHCVSLYDSASGLDSRGEILEADLYPRYFNALVSENRISAGDAMNDPRYSELVETYMKPLGITSMLDSSIFVEGTLAGVICLEHIGPLRGWHADEESFMSTMSSVVAQLLVNRERRKAEEAMVIFKESLENSTDSISMSTPEGRHYYQNRAFTELFGDVGDDPFDVYVDREVARDVFDTIMKGEIWTGEVRMYAKERRIVDILLRAYANYDGQGNITALVGVHTDITVLRMAEEERAKLKDQLNQAQRMESVGRLAGGIAHDFNNMLGVILGHAEMILMKMDGDDARRADMQEIKQAAKRSADLTRQLLAFARRQTAMPVVMDLNETIAGMLKMLTRLIGEDINLAWLPGQDIWSVRLDPSQVDQILVNLCVNARDAIKGVGKIAIETGNAVFDEDYCADHADYAPGSYVMLAVSDNGCGMDHETVSNIFEPFYTTKGVGKGTGLGLAMVYGIVRQNEGFINVYSEPGEGTTFRLYFPRYMGEEKYLRKASPVEQPCEGRETILLVEDEPMILNLARTMLNQAGYTVLTASTPGEAISTAETHRGEIHLLITDVIMPEMNGRDLAKRILSLYPAMKRLFMSGYTESVIAHHGVLDTGMYFIQKPFTIVDLTVKVREALDSQ